MYRIVHFALEINRPVDASLHRFRAAVTDMARVDIRRDFERAESAGVDVLTVCQKFALKWNQAQRASKMVRAIPSQMFNWAINAEMRVRGGNELNYPHAAYGTVGSFQPGDVKLLHGNVVTLNFGGMGGVGTIAAEDMGAVAMHEFAEARISYDQVDGKFYGSLVFLSNSGNRDDAEDPVDGEPEYEDA